MCPNPDFRLRQKLNNYKCATADSQATFRPCLVVFKFYLFSCGFRTSDTDFSVFDMRPCPLRIRHGRGEIFAMSVIITFLQRGLSRFIFLKLHIFAQFVPNNEMAYSQWDGNVMLLLFIKSFILN